MCAVTVMLIDDERAIREGHSAKLLRPMQVDVLVAGDHCRSGRARRGRLRPRSDLILSDWRLRGNRKPACKPWRAVRRICGEATPAVLITGDTFGRGADACNMRTV